MADITIVNGVYKPTNITGGHHPAGSSCPMGGPLGEGESTVLEGNFQLPPDGHRIQFIASSAVRLGGIAVPKILGCSVHPMKKTMDPKMKYHSYIQKSGIFGKKNE